jgi:hypothetical protein
VAAVVSQTILTEIEVAPLATLCVDGVIDIVSVDAETGKIATREPATMATTIKPPKIAFFRNDSFNFSSFIYID